MSERRDGECVVNEEFVSAHIGSDGTTTVTVEMPLDRLTATIECIGRISDDGSEMDVETLTVCLLPSE